MIRDPRNSLQANANRQFEGTGQIIQARTTPSKHEKHRLNQVREDDGHDCNHNEHILDHDQWMWMTQDEVDVEDLLNLADLAYDINQVIICFPLYPLTVYINRGLFCFQP